MRTWIWRGRPFCAWRRSKDGASEGVLAGWCHSWTRAVEVMIRDVERLKSQLDSDALRDLGHFQQGGVQAEGMLTANLAGTERVIAGSVSGRGQPGVVTAIDRAATESHAARLGHHASIVVLLQYAGVETAHLVGLPVGAAVIDGSALRSLTRFPEESTGVGFLEQDGILRKGGRGLLRAS